MLPFVKKYARLGETVPTATREYIDDVRAGRYPQPVSPVGAWRARQGTVAVSIFVNPLQFDREEDLRAYPRSLDADGEFCRRLGVDVVFAPSAEEMYPAVPFGVVDVSRVADHLCGKHRPGHFRGVATVVMKLFQVTQADRAYFGEKDRQHIVGVPTVREPDGLALSSRNRRLGPDERAVGDPDVVKAKAAAQVPESPLLWLEHLEVVDPDDMSPVAHIAGPVIVAGALWVRATRLIDNLACSPPKAVA